MPLIHCGNRHSRQRELTAGEIGVRYNGNGDLAFLAWCEECQAYSSSPVHGAYVKALGIALDKLPVVADYRGFYAICSVRGCGRDDVELNHFAPQAIFREKANDWPRAFLCREHHREWGERVTPSLNPPRRRTGSIGA